MKKDAARPEYEHNVKICVPVCVHVLWSEKEEWSLGKTFPRDEKRRLAMAIRNAQYNTDNSSTEKTAGSLNIKGAHQVLLQGLVVSFLDGWAGLK